MPYFTDKDIMDRLQEHLAAALEAYPEMDWFVIVAQGSMNYGMMDEESDIDSKLLSIPSLREIVLNMKPRNKVFEMPNTEHVDIKDVREYFKIFRKSNINFVEILFSDYWIANPKYKDLWLELKANAEELARINPYAAVSCMKGMAAEKLHALCHEYPSRMPWIERYGYDPKQLSHLYRILFFLNNYVNGELYSDCIYLKNEANRQWLLQIKRNGAGASKEEAIEGANFAFNLIKDIADNFRETTSNEINNELDKFLNDVLYRLISRALKEELNE